MYDKSLLEEFKDVTSDLAHLELQRKMLTRDLDIWESKKKTSIYHWNESYKDGVDSEIDDINETLKANALFIEQTIYDIERILDWHDDPKSLRKYLCMLAEELELENLPSLGVIDKLL